MLIKWNSPLFLLMHTQGQLPPHFSSVLTPACHYRRLAPAVNDADEPNLLFREVPRRNV